MHVALSVCCSMLLFLTRHKFAVLQVQKLHLGHASSYRFSCTVKVQAPISLLFIALSTPPFTALANQLRAVEHI